MKPLFAYAGGKAKIVKKLPFEFPRRETFVDLFAGGLALTCHAYNNNKADYFIINDLNANIIRLLETVRDYPNEVIKYSAILDNNLMVAANQRQYYYMVREAHYKDPDDPHLWYFLARECFSGNHTPNCSGRIRESTKVSNDPINPRGLMNFGWGPHRIRYANPDSIIEWCRFLRSGRVILVNKPYEAVSLPSHNYFIAMDPPYLFATVKYISPFDHRDTLRLLEYGRSRPCCMFNSTDGLFFESNADGYYVAPRCDSWIELRAGVVSRS